MQIWLLDLRLCYKQALVDCGRKLVGYLDATRAMPLHLRPKDRQTVVDLLVSAAALREQAGVEWKPKWHMCLHIADDCKVAGNPYRNGTWLDESLNACLAKVAGSAHRAVWSCRIMSVFGHAMGPTSEAARNSKKQRIEK